MQNTNDTTLETVVKAGHKQLSQEELTDLMSDNTVWGEYFFPHACFDYASYNRKDNTMHGINHVGYADKGKWTVNQQAMLSVSWAGSWENWTAIAFKVDGMIKFFDETGRYRMNMTNVLKGEHALTLKGL